MGFTYRVFFSSCNSVQFHAELLNYIDIPVLSIHGKQKQQRRTAVFLEFVNASKGVLLCTDVAARGLDIPAVDWIIQYDPADDPKEYIHRVGRTARGEKGAGRALMFLLPDVSDTGDIGDIGNIGNTGNTYLTYYTYSTHYIIILPTNSYLHSFTHSLIH